MNKKINELAGSMYSIQHESQAFQDYTCLIQLWKCIPQLEEKEIFGDAKQKMKTFFHEKEVKNKDVCESRATIWIKKYMYYRLYKERDENGFLPIHVSILTHVKIFYN